MIQDNPELDARLSQPQEAPLPPSDGRSGGWQRFVVPVGIGLLLLGGIGWIVFNRVVLPMMLMGQMKPQAMPVPLANPKSAPIEDSSDYAASLDSRQSVTLQPRVAGQVSAIYVKPGDFVKAGQPLLQIDASEQRAQVASRTAAAQTAEAEVDSAQADVTSAQKTLRSLEASREVARSNVQLNQQEYERFKSLYNQGAESKQLLDQKLNALQTAQAELQRADADIQAQKAVIDRNQAIVEKNRRSLEQSQADIAQGVAQLKYYNITAPFDGVVGNIPVKVGDFVNVSTQLLSVTQNRNLEVQIGVPLDKSSSLRLGLPVKLIDDRDQTIASGKVAFIAPNVDPATQSIQVKAAFENNGSKLRTDQFVRARVIWQTRPGLLVPTTAISRLGGRDFIFVATPYQTASCPASPQGKAAAIAPDQLVAAQKPIRLGKIVGNDQEVLDGLNAADRIVVSGILQLQNCMPIAPKPAQPQG